jgi:hypothetical protein
MPRFKLPIFTRYSLAYIEKIDKVTHWKFRLWWSRYYRYLDDGERLVFYHHDRTLFWIKKPKFLLTKSDREWLAYLESRKNLRERNQP